MTTRALSTTHPCFISTKLLTAAALARPLRRIAAGGKGAGLAAPAVAAFASELILGGVETLPPRASSTRYLVVIDVPEPALMRLPGILELRRPEYRLHITRDLGVVRRLLVSSVRGDPRLGIVDAYVLGASLVVLTGDFELRSFPIGRIAALDAIPPTERSAFEIDADGSYLHWPAHDLHLGVSQLLQAADPAYLIDIEIERNSNDFSGRALRSIREERGLRQADIPGLSERQVRRIEDGVSRLRPGSARSFADALELTVAELLTQIGRRAAELRGRK